MYFRATLRTLLGLVLAFVCVASAKAQGPIGEILGTVRDQSGAVVPGANVRLVSESQGWTRSATTSDVGIFDFPAVPVGHYSLKVEKTGFTTYSQKGIVLQSDMQAKVDVSLTVGASTQMVNVTANAVQVDTTSSAQKQVIDRERVQDLPLNGRDARQLISLVAGGIQMAPVDQFIASPSFSVNGANQDQVNFRLDGAEHNDTWFGSGLAYPNPDALQEFTVQTNNFSAKYGRDAGAVIDAVIRSGSNTLHGSAYEFLRNNVLDSRPFFAKTTPVFKRNQFGATLGGPLVLPNIYNGRDKTFWFFSWETLRQVGSPGVATYTTLDQDERNGLVASAKPITNPATGLPFPTDSQGRYIIAPLSMPIQNFINKYLPLPASTTSNLNTFPQGGFNFNNQYITRFDHQLTDRDSLSFSYFFYSLRGLVTYGAGIGPDQSWFDDSHVRTQSFTLNETHSFSPTTVNHVNATLEIERHLMLPRTTFKWSDFGSTLQPADNSPLVDEAVSVSGYFSTYTGFQWINGRNNPYFSDELALVRGRHTLTVGGELGYTEIWNRTPYYIGGSASFSGYSTGNPVADFLLGDMSSWTQQSRNEEDLRQARIALYLNDDFKVTPRLTLNLGVRWEPFFPEDEIRGRQGFWNPGHQSTRFPNAPLGQLFAYDPGIPCHDTVVCKDWNNFAPRIGFAWDPTGSHKWAVRSAYGLFYGGLDIGIRTIRGIYNQPFTRVISVSDTNIAAPYNAPPYNGNSPFPYSPPTTAAGDQTVQFATAANVVGWDGGFATPYVQQYNFSVERELAKDWLFEVAYVGSKTTKLFDSHNINPAIYIPGVNAAGQPNSTEANTQARRIFPNIGHLEIESSEANTNYNSLQLKLDKRLSKGLTVLGSYVYSKDLGWNVPLGEGGGGTRDELHPEIDYGVLSDNIPQRLTTSFVWELPGPTSSRRAFNGLVRGWGLQGILIWQSGFPFTARSGVDNSFSGTGADTADQIGNPDLSANRSRGAKLAEWFNTAAYRANAVGTFGTTGINTLRGPAFGDFDFALTKSTHITERQAIEFRAEFFNVLNHPAFGNPNSNLTAASTFGRITSTATGYSPRNIEFALRYAF